MCSYAALQLFQLSCIKMSMTAAPLLWINGFPGSGKPTVGTALRALDEATIVIDNHKMIDPVEAKFSRSHPQYQAERQQQRKLMFDDYVFNTARSAQVIVFTDQGIDQDASLCQVRLLSW